MKSSAIILNILIGFPIVIFARPDLYKESEDFKYSRSSDGASKSGFYESQRGNMGGNYEKAYNMDNMAHRQLSELATGVGGQVTTNLRAGSTFGSASTSGTEYGAVKNAGLATGAGLGTSTSLGLNGISDTNYGATSGSNYNQEYGQSSNLNRYSTYNRNAATLHSGSRYNSLGSTGSNLALEQGSHQHQATVGQDAYHGGAQGQTYYDASTGQYIQQRNHGQSTFDATSAQTVQGNSHLSSASRPLTIGQTQGSSQLSSYHRPLVVNPIRIQVVPGRVVPLTVPVTAQTSSSVNQYSSAQLHNEASSNVNGEYDSSLHGNAQDYNAANSQLATGVNNRGGKNYQSSYSYSKQWERHGTPVVTNVAPQVTIPVVVPVGTVPESADLLQTQDSSLSNQKTQGSLHYNSGSRVASTSGQRYGETQYSNANTYTAQDNSQLEDTLTAASNVNQASNINSQRLLTADQQFNTELDQLATGNQGRPKSYQSSYSYHKSWERHGTPYVIKPLATVDGSVDLNTQGLNAAAQLLQNQQNHQSSSSSYSKNAYRSQASTSGLSGASNSRYQQGGSLCDADCYNSYLRENENNLESRSYRNKRSYNAHQYANKPRNYPNDDSEENYGLDQQQLQHFNQDIDDGQQVEDFGQQIEQNIDNGQQIENFDQAEKNIYNGQQAVNFGQIEKTNDDGQQEENFGQASIPVEANDGQLFHVQETTPKSLSNKPDEQYSFLFPKPVNFNPTEESTTKKTINNFHSYNSHTWSQHFPTDENLFLQLENQNQFSQYNPNIDNYFEMMNKQFEESLRNPNLYKTRLGFTLQHPIHYFPANQRFNNDFGHDRNIHDKQLFLHKQSHLDTDCDKHTTVTTVRSMDVEDVLKRINELQKELGIDLTGFNKPEISKPKTTIDLPKPITSQTNIWHLPREKTPEEIEALSLTRNTITPKKSNENDEHIDVNIYSKSNQNKPTSNIDNQNNYINDKQHISTILNPEKSIEGQFNVQTNLNTNLDQNLNINNIQKEYSNSQNRETLQKSFDQYEDQESQDFGQQTQDFSQVIEDVGQQTEDLGQKPVDFDQQNIQHFNQEIENGYNKPLVNQQNTPKIDQQIDSNVGFQLGIVRQQFQEPKNIQEKEINTNFLSREKLHENQENKDTLYSGFQPQNRGYNYNINKNNFNIETQNKERKDFSEELGDVGQESLNIGQNLLDIGQTQVDFDQKENLGQSQIAFEHPKIEQNIQENGQTQINVDLKSQNTGQMQLDLEHEPQNFEQGSYENIQHIPRKNEGNLQVGYGINGQIDLQTSLLETTNQERIKQEITSDQKYKNLEINESADVQEEVTTAKPGFFRNVGNKIKNIFG